MPAGEKVDQFASGQQVSNTPTDDLGDARAHNAFLQIDLGSVKVSGPLVGTSIDSLPRMGDGTPIELNIHGSRDPSFRCGRQGVSVHPRLAFDIVDCNVRVVPGESWTNSEAIGQFGDLALAEPRLSRLPVLPEVDAARAGISVEVVLSDQALRRQITVDRGCARPALDGLFFGPLGKIELNNDDASCHGVLLFYFVDSDFGPTTSSGPKR
jgi:hypothetical protein